MVHEDGICNPEENNVQKERTNHHHHHQLELGMILGNGGEDSVTQLLQVVLEKEDES